MGAAAVFAVVNMFNIFKRSTPARAAANDVAPETRRSPAPKAVAPVLPERPALPDVVEGNEHTDWALWEDSVMVMDSQMQGLTPSARIYEREKQTQSEFQDIDPFSRVNKKSA